jgi:eukaryotic-like serine/threonine-protein kinase
MTPEHWKIVKNIFCDAVEVPLERRHIFVIERCGTDEALRREIEDLLLAAEDSPSPVSVPGLLSLPTLAGLAENAYSPGHRVGPYRILRLIGRGGMGEVYQAQDARLGREVAIKILHPDLVVAGRFEYQIIREARASALLNHPNIVSIFDVLDEDGRALIVMEYLEGQTLAARLASGPLEAHVAFEIGSALTAALAHAHEHGVLHCDIKPANIFLLPDGALKVLDFGLARRISGNASPEESQSALARHPQSRSHRGMTSALLHHAGTPKYMAPEQLAGTGSDARSDLYSIGLVLLEATGAWPSVGKECETPLRAVERVPFKWLRPVLQRSLAESPEDRFQSVALQRQALEEAARAARVGFDQVRGSGWVVASVAAVLLCTFVTSALVWLTAGRERSTSPVAVVVQQLTTNASTMPVSRIAMAPDGKRLAYVDRRGIWIRELNTHAVNLVPDTAGYALIRWLPDGSGVLASSRNGNASRRADVFAELGWLREARIEEIYQFPSSDRAVWLASYLNISLMLHTQRAKRPLTGALGFPAPVWSPEERYVLALARIVPTLSHAESFELRAYSVKTGKHHTIVALPQGVDRIPFTALSDGRVWYALPERRGSTLWEVRVASSSGVPRGAPRQVAHLPGLVATQLSSSRNGKSVALLAFKQGNRIAIMDWPSKATLAPARRLTTEDKHETLRFWSFDSRTLYFESDHQGKPWLFRQALQDDSPSTIELLPDRFKAATLTPNGRDVLYESTDMGPFSARIIRRPLRPFQEDLAGPKTEWKEVVGRKPTCTLATPAQPCFAIEEPFDLGLKRVFAFDPGSGATISRVDIPGDARHVVVSPSGARIAYSSRAGTIVILDGRGQFLRELPLSRLGFGPQDSTVFTQPISMTWAADEQGLFVGYMDPKRSLGHLSCILLHVSLAGNRHELSQNACSALHSPDGRLLALDVTEVTGNVWLLEPRDRP